MYKKIISIDLDGVLNEYSGNFEKDKIPPIKNGAEEFLKKLSEEFEIKIYTTRNKLLTARWVFDNNLEKYITDITDVKDSYTSIYIDERCICFEGNFEELFLKIQKFKVYWKK